MFSGKSLGFQRYQNSPAMKKLSSNPKIASALDLPGERAEFFKDLQKAGKDGVTKNNVKEVLGKYMAGKGKTISRKEGSIIASEIFKGESVKYISPKSDAVRRDPSANRVSAANPSENSKAAQTALSTPKTISMTGSRTPSGLAASVSGGDNKGSFSRAFSATTMKQGTTGTREIIYEKEISNDYSFRLSRPTIYLLIAIGVISFFYFWLFLKIDFFLSALLASITFSGLVILRILIGFLMPATRKVREKN